MTRSPYPAPPVCTDPAIGAAVTQALGRRPPPPVASHLASCLACRIQRAAFNRLDEDAAAPSLALRARVRRRVISSARE